MRLKKQEEEKRNRALKLLEMPPPKINFSHMRTIYGPRPGIGFPDGWKRNYENSIGAHSRFIVRYSLEKGFQNFFPSSYSAILDLIELNLITRFSIFNLSTLLLSFFLLYFLEETITIINFNRLN